MQGFAADGLGSVERGPDEVESAAEMFTEW
jgi:hypothetical protein